MIDTLYTDEGLKERLNGYISRPSYTIKGIKEILLVTAIIRFRNDRIYETQESNKLFTSIDSIAEKYKDDIDTMVSEFSALVKEFYPKTKENVLK